MQKKTAIILSCFLLTFIFLTTSCSNATSHNDTSSNTHLIDTYGRLTGVNWFGFETSNYVVHGLWTRDYKSMLQQVKDLGFNTIRIPWSNEMLGTNYAGVTATGVVTSNSETDSYTGNTGINTDISSLNSLDLLDKIIDEANTLGLYIVLDNHTRAASANTEEELWYTHSFTESQWIADWEFMINRYLDKSNVIGADLNNEPHGSATWGDGSATDWKVAAETCGEALVAINPNLIIFVEGIETSASGNRYWWGANLEDAATSPINTTKIPAKNLMYSVHEYGTSVANQSWLSDSNFPNNLQSIWDQFFWFLYKDSGYPIYVGEFGITEADAANSTSTDYIWLTNFLEYVGDTASWTFWSLNPNSGDTGGILADDWVTVQSSKYDLIQPYLNN